MVSKGGSFVLNQVVLVGRLVKKPELRESVEKKKFAYITLAVPRSFKNVDGKYDTDFIECALWENIAINTTEYCDKGDIIGIRGRIQTRTEEKDSKKEKVTEIICEKITFLTSGKSSDENESEEE
jgi:single-strand DNA-binding protein